MGEALAPYVRVERVQGHISMHGGRLAGPPFDLTQVDVRVSPSCWMVVASSPTTGDGLRLPVRVRG